MHAHNFIDPTFIDTVKYLWVVPFGTALDIRTFGSSQTDLAAHGSFHFYARVESELSLRLHGKTIEFDNAGYFILVRHEHCDS